MGHDQRLAGLQQQRIRLGVGLEHVGQSQLELGRDRFQRLARLLYRHHVFQIFTHQAAVGRRQGIFDSKRRRGAQDEAAAQHGRSFVEELHNFPVMNGVIRDSGPGRDRRCHPGAKRRPPFFSSAGKNSTGKWAYPRRIVSPARSP
ncbi:hypothetical protein D3C78_1384120 [compost metagenome]